MTNDKRKPQVGKQLLLRFAEGSDLRDRLDEIAKANGRSTTAEVLIRLEASLKADKSSGGLSFMKHASSARVPPSSDLEARVLALETAIADLQGSKLP